MKAAASLSCTGIERFLGEDESRVHALRGVSLDLEPGTVHAVVKGRCWGRIIHEHKGSGGFGYDPYFLILAYHQTFGELSARVKHALSHRGKALAQLRPMLRQLLK